MRAAKEAEARSRTETGFFLKYGKSCAMIKNNDYTVFGAEIHCFA